MDKSKVTKAATKFEKIHLQCRTNLNAKVNLHVIYCKILSDLEQEKSRSGS